jgi:hypothetical protein
MNGQFVSLAKNISQGSQEALSIEGNAYWALQVIP